MKTTMTVQRALKFVLLRPTAPEAAVARGGSELGVGVDAIRLRGARTGRTRGGGMSDRRSRAGGEESVECWFERPGPCCQTMGTKTSRPALALSCMRTRAVRARP